MLIIIIIIIIIIIMIIIIISNNKRFRSISVSMLLHFKNLKRKTTVLNTILKRFRTRNRNRNAKFKNDQANYY